MTDQRLKKYNLITIFLAVLEFVLILCVPLVNLDGSPAQKIGAYILAALFWICIAVEGIFVHLSTQERRWMERRGFRNRALKHSSPDVISFFKNQEATVVDVILFISALLVVILVWAQVKTGWMIMAGILVLFLTFNLHCVLNGKNYRYLKLYKKEQKKDE